MDPIEEQRRIIDKLYRLVHRSAPKGFSQAACRFQYLRESDGSAAVDDQFWYFLDGRRVSALLIEDNAADPLQSVPQLHAKMQAHTGGGWEAFTLTINKDGSVTTRFEYPKQNG